MELQRGVCSLCSEKTRVLAPSDAEDYCKFLPEILHANFLTEMEFQTLKNQIKLCPICCYKVQIAKEAKNLFRTENENMKSKLHACYFCNTDGSLMKIGTDWKYFNDRTEEYLNLSDFPICACPRCLFFFDTSFNIKTKLLYKFPQLALHKKKSGETPQKQNITPKRKSLLKSPPSSKRRKIFGNCFANLQPLCNNIYHVDDELKQDKRLYRKIAYVNLTNSKDVEVKETPKMRPIIKIKLKPRSKKSEKEDLKFLPYVKLCKSEEVPTKGKKTKARRHSLVVERETSEEPQEKLDETPKAPITSNLVPKRRVSVFDVDVHGDGDCEKEDKEEIKEDSEEISKVVDKYIPDEVTGEEEEKNVSEADEERVDENGIDKASESNEENVLSEHLQSIELTNGEKSDNFTENSLEKKQEESGTQIISSDSESDTPRKSPIRNESSSGGSDSEANDKQKVRDNPDLDSLNGSERKKKRVTFSDEIID